MVLIVEMPKITIGFNFLKPVVIIVGVDGFEPPTLCL